MSGMKPTRDCTLVDLVDTILNKGVIINADVIVSVAGIPLIGVNLNAALAGMETMLKYGLMEAWDESIRRYYAEEIAEKRKVPLAEGEKIILQAFASYHYVDGIYNAWRPGQLYLTDERLFLFRREPPEMLFEVPLERIKKLVKKEDEYFVGKKEILHVLLDTGEVISINTRDVAELKRTIENGMKIMGLVLEQEIILPFEEREPQFLEKNEDIIQTEKIWCLYSGSWIIKSRWKPGRICITSKRVHWQYEFDPKISFDVPISNVTNLVVEEVRSMKDKKFGSIIGKMKENEYTLVLAYRASEDEHRILFSGEQKKLNRLKLAIENMIVPVMPVIA